MKTNQLKISSIQAGVSGEYFVAAELARRGFIASVTLKNTRGIDILVANESATRTLGVQVKTNQSSRRAWLLNQKAEEFFADDLYYVFVNLIGLDQLPEYYVVPSGVVAKEVMEGHKAWLKKPGKKGQAHNDSNMRMFGDEDQKYLNRWDLLEM